MKHRLVDLWLAPLRLVERVIKWFETPRFYVGSDQQMSPEDQMHYSGLTLFISVFGACLLTTIVLIVLGGVG